MNVQDAAYHVVHDYEGGAHALAARLGTTGATLGNKVRPNYERNKLSLDDAVQITDFANDDRILYAWAAHRGLSIIDKRPEACSSPLSLFTCILDVTQGQGDVAKAIADAIADGRITPNELDAIERAAIELQQRVTELARSARATVPKAPV